MGSTQLYQNSTELITTKAGQIEIKKDRNSIHPDSSFFITLPQGVLTERQFLKLLRLRIYDHKEVEIKPSSIQITIQNSGKFIQFFINEPELSSANRCLDRSTFNNLPSSVDAGNVAQLKFDFISADLNFTLKVD